MIESKYYLKELFKENKGLIFQLITKYYSFELTDLLKLNKNVDWMLLSNNENILWSIDFVKEYKDKLCFDHLAWYNFEDPQRPGLSSNSKINLDILKKYSNKLSWEMVSWNFDFYNTNIDLILENKNLFWNWYYLSRNKTLVWSEDFIDKYQYEISWDDLCSNGKVNWTESLIKKYEKKLNWDSLSFKENLPWSSSFFLKYETQLNINNLSWNNGFSWNEELIEKYKENINWEHLSENTGVQWSSDLIERFGCENFDVFDNERHLSKKFGCFELSKNPSLPWNDINFFLKFIHFYILDCDFSGLISNNGINWCEMKIKICEMKWTNFQRDKVILPKRNLKNIDFYINKNNELDENKAGEIIWNIISPLIDIEEVIFIFNNK
ncbi:hypothetical protein [Tenacibaculum finnmarkense]|uniref:Uncharacterized protein n=1 Tax=Tenacibaculum finnmarkense genomovar finnmarkense TaxID=1458503 RepID=A0AAP1RHN9_9FLAO|nr:hypothetical protein [Tenacibaculum finnmarkense]MBE7653927.1 hypothetical protein [Tenacibaculum finnmarkense genomovar finnmarkense]MBE7696229.1 hypothetical protein [Tenacibaculum finnmarkense genomovar finnmarkense]MCD8428472.1 hypothetical protein [Tenacibaculum finnmarkense genomovar finnmarkense]MCG8732246.1 hypothetical protein [Tenacibaculum finnmarkense]MCG8752923.1 hypothetical protein [Tenacibaculum finnmarkense]